MSEKTCPHCGCVIVKGRSLPDHRRFFALIHAAYHHWPENHRFRPDNSEHLRAWLTAKAGHRNTTELFLPDGATPEMKRLYAIGTEAAIKATGGTGWVVPYNDSLVVISPKSIAWDEIDQKQFSVIRDAVSDVIEAETGIAVDALLREMAA